MLATARSVLRSGGLPALYSGLTVNLYGSGAAWGLYFFGYNFLQSRIRKWQGRDELDSSEYFLAANITGATICVVTNPIWVVKTRMQLQDTMGGASASSSSSCSSSSSRTGRVHYTSLWDGLYKLGKHEGVKGLSRGLVPNLFNVVHGSIHISTYEWLRSFTQRHLVGGGPQKSRHDSAGTGGWASLPEDTSGAGQGDRPLSALQTMACAAGAKTFALVTTYPLQVFRTRQHRAPPPPTGAAEMLSLIHI